MTLTNSSSVAETVTGQSSAGRPTFAEVREFVRNGVRFVRIAADFRTAIVLPLVTALIPFWRRSRSAPKERAFRVKMNGQTVTLRLCGWTEYEVLREIALDHEYELQSDIEPRTVLDLGAQVGVSAVHFATAFPHARIIAVEADPSLIERLKRNVAEFPVTVINAAIASEGGSVAFFRGADSWANSLSRADVEQEEILVDAVTIEDVLRSHELEHVDLMKVDVEGAEWQLFEGGVPGCVDYFVGEIHAYCGRPPEQLLARLEHDLELHSARVSDVAIVFEGPRKL